MYIRWQQARLHGDLLHPHCKKREKPTRPKGGRQRNETKLLSQLNTSRIGQTLVQAAENETSTGISSLDPTGGILSGWLKNATSGLTNKIEGIVNSAVTDLAKEFGVEDFYSLHLMDYCEGTFTPGPLPNATLKASSIHRNVTYCSNRTAMVNFDPTAALQRTLNESGTGITLADLHWPSQIEDGIRDLKVAINVTFVLYCIGAALAFVVFLVGLAWIFSAGGRGRPLLEFVLAFLTFLVLAIASIVITVVGVKGSNIINKYGDEIGVEANRGNGYLGLTWASTGLMLVASVIGLVGLCGSRKRRVKEYSEK
jgi:hypothetical protein